MAKWYGKVGFGITKEIRPGVSEPDIKEALYFGDVLRNSRRWQNGEYLNDNLTISNQLSIVADPYAFHHFHEIRYVEWMGARWKVSTVSVEYPRLVLEIGEVYNGPGPKT